MKSVLQLIFEFQVPVLGIGEHSPFRLARLALLTLISMTAPQLCASEQSDSGDVVLVSTAAELVAALEPQSAVLHIRVRRGDYAVDRPLTVPDGAILEGEGIMRVDNGLPVGFEPGTMTTIRVTAGFEGDLLTLGNGVVLRGLRLEDLKTKPGSEPQRSGNVIVVGSRAAGDTVSAQIADCEIVSPNQPGVGTEGPTGHALVVLTRNPGRHQTPPPHVGATINARLERSVVRANGSALFAINFAADGALTIALDGNRLEGILSAAGGASRPDEVSGASVTVESRDNLYALRPGGQDAFGWRVIGGSSSHLADLGAPGANHNLVRIKSVNDRIEGFKIGILAA
ncbi:MAG TPA: hypothetical protein VI566_07880, partial [Xanthomonadales bacterium]|nr:hypothetical protein [Xanthomonadales bacterium]